MEIWLLLTAYRKSPALYPMVLSPTPTTYRLATIPFDWHTIVCYDLSASSKVSDLHVIWKPICDFLLVINSNLGHILHRFATDVTDGQTDRRTTTTMPIARPLLRNGRLKTRCIYLIMGNVNRLAVFGTFQGWKGVHFLSLAFVLLMGWSNLQ